MHNSRLCETSGIVYNEQGRVAVGCSLEETSFLRRCTGEVGGKGRKGGGGVREIPLAKTSAGQYVLRTKGRSCPIPTTCSPQEDIGSLICH